MSTEPVDLELAIRSDGPDHYAVDLRVVQPQSDVDQRPLRDEQVRVQFQRARLLAAELDPPAYGRALSAMLFERPSLAQAFAASCAVAQSQSRPLRLRIAIARDATELHELHWELLTHPVDQTPLGTNGEIYLSRYLASADWQPFRPRARGDLKALALIASPVDLVTYGLTSLDVPRQQALIERGFAGLRLTVRAGTGQSTFEQLVADLKQEPDILCIVAHGVLKAEGEQFLWLEDSQGKTDLVSGSRLLDAVAAVASRPRLVCLIACDSGGKGDQALTALGPRLAALGVPAVIAIRGKIAIKSAEVFLETCMRELMKKGYIDRAVAMGRQAIGEQPGFVAPMLFLRLRSGRIWYDPGFASDTATFSRWPALVGNILDQSCTPILGMGLLESLVGSTRDIARRLAEAHGYPLSLTLREDLPQVTQFIASTQNYDLVPSQLQDVLRKTLQQRFGVALGTALGPGAALEDLLHAAWQSRAHEPYEPFRALASLPFEYYLTASPDPLLATALRAAGRAPEMYVCPWNDEIKDRGGALGEQFSIDRPLVYHLFGRLQERESLVITEDDYFRYLIGVTSNRDLIPNVVRYRLANSALLFLGFRLDDWNFRVLFRSVMKDDVRNRRLRFRHVAVQLDVDEAETTRPDLVRRYLEDYFGESAVSIFWGSADDFIGELLERTQAASRTRSVL